ncbi:putative Group XV phospholipase A2 [Paratrimastix pyriformis]|uniref:Group XV phospholipase A2 n=1 Tax=Paratrimastix pyriformis TaxID=342808 RepID=A0ABQ8UMD3_9EUKA|nr:putative Group XV phospholipase A2 [Paratrimastix pyriformis]
MRLFGLLVATFVLGAAVAASLEPVIIVPGLSASVLETRYHKKTVPHVFCDKNVDNWKRIWVRATEMAPEIIDCFLQTMGPVYDGSSNTYSNCEGVQMQPHDFGGLEGIYSLDPDLREKTEVYGPLIDYFVKRGYKAGETLYGAPYDWRVTAPDVNAKNGMYAALQTLVEQAVNRTGQPAHLIGHSLGSPFVHMFLATYTTQAWRDRYVGSFISLAGPFGGSTMATEYTLCGMDWRVPGLSKSHIRDLMRNMGSAAWMMPFGPGADYVILSTPQRNYSLEDLPQLFLDAGAPSTAAMVRHVQTYLDQASVIPPGVETHLFYSRNTTTPLTYYEPAGVHCSGDQAGPEVVASRPGDGTVVDWSLLGYAYWKTQPQPLTSYEVASDHVGVISDPMVLKLIGEIVGL